MTTISYLNSLLEYNVIMLPFVASEDAETLDEMIRGTEEQLGPTTVILIIRR